MKMNEGVTIHSKLTLGLPPLEAVLLLILHKNSTQGRHIVIFILSTMQFVIFNTTIYIHTYIHCSLEQSL